MANGAQLERHVVHASIFVFDPVRAKRELVVEHERDELEEVCARISQRLCRRESRFSQSRVSCALLLRFRTHRLGVRSVFLFDER